MQKILRQLRNNKLNLGIILAHIVFMLLNGVPFIFGDGYGYFHIAKSLVDQGSFVSTAQPDYFPYSAHAVAFDGAKYVTVYSPGSALLLLPGLVTSRLFASGNSFNEYYQAFNGHTFADGLATLVTATICSIASLLLIIDILKLLKFRSRVAAFSAIAIYLASFITVYVFENPSYSHIYEVVCVSLVLWLMLKSRIANQFHYWVGAAGLVAGLAFLVRPTSLLLVLPLGLLLWNQRRFKDLLIYAIGFLPGIGLFVAYNVISYGKPLTTGYGALWGQNFDFSQFNLAAILFSDIRGWFYYSPVMLVAMVGLVLFVWKSWTKAATYLAPVLAMLILYAFWPNWWGGGSIGQRFFLCLIPFTAIGLAQIIDLLDRQRLQIKQSLLTVIIVLCSYSLSITLLSRVTPLNQIGFSRTDWQQVPAAERFSPADIFGYHANLLRASTSVKDYGQKFIGGLNGGRSIALLALGLTDPLARIEQSSEHEFSVHLIPNNKNSVREVEITVGSATDIAKAIKLADLTTEQYRSIKVVCLEICSANGSQPAAITTIPAGNYQFANAVFFATSTNLKLINPKLK